MIILGGTLAGIGLLVLYTSKAFSYMSDDPAVCINCHIMVPQYANWAHSAHRERATCNDCHVPHDNFVRHWLFKAKDGTRHAFMFTFRLEPQAIIMHEAGQQAVQQNCLRCHDRLLHNVHQFHAGAALERRCWECHRSTPHGRVRSLSSVPYAQAPLLQSIIPDALQNLFRRRENLTNHTEGKQ